MKHNEAAILRTILYADVFDFPLTLAEIHRYLINDICVPLDSIKALIEKSPTFEQLLYQADGYICLEGRQAIIEKRQAREAISQTLWERAMRYGRWLSHIPFVRMVTLTGALAMRNPSSEKDDFDYLLITTPRRVWLARAFAVILVRIVRLLGDELCPNYVLASDQLEQNRQDLYMAHEVTQMQPIYGETLYQAMYDKNTWTQYYLPNALPYSVSPDSPRRMRQFFEMMLGGKLGDALEAWEYRRKLDKFRPRIEQEQSSAEIDESSVKGHFEDHGMPVLTRYEILLEQYGLLENSQALAGD